MAEDAASRGWVVEPPGRGEVLFHLATGDGVTLSDEQEAAVYALMRTLESSDPEVTGHALDAKCPSLQSCYSKTCPPLNCKVLSCNPLTASGLTGGMSIMGAFSPS